MPRGEDMRLEPSLNVTPKGSLIDIPSVVKREIREQVPEGELLGTSSETTYMEIPNTCLKTVHKSPSQGVPKTIYGEQKKQVEKKHISINLTVFLLLLIEEMLVSPLEVS